MNNNTDDMNKNYEDDEETWEPQTPEEFEALYHILTAANTAVVENGNKAREEAKHKNEAE